MESEPGSYCFRAFLAAHSGSQKRGILLQILLLFPIILPIIAGIMVRVLDLEDRRKRQLFVGAAVIISMLFTVLVLLLCKGQTLTLFQVSPGFSFVLAVDSLSVVFGLLVSILWVFTTFYAFGYMSHEGGEVRFFTFFTMAMGVSVGLSLAANPVTLYLFYELLTFITFPLVTHAGTKEAIAAGRKYLVYSIGGATLGLVSIVFATAFSTSLAANAPEGLMFTLGGFLSPEAMQQYSGLLQAMYFVGFLGFGVKSAVFPLHGWLPSAYVAPTPVTALLHAVAVVKAGIFAIIRLTYYSYGADFIKGTWAQIVPLVLIFITILYGSSMALRTRHLKKRLAYSTISQLSYILFAVMMLTDTGLQAGLIYMVFHAIIKITLFFCCGSVMFTTDTTDVHEMNGYGKIMPGTFACFAIASLGLTGVPPTAGFFGKFYLATAAFTSGQLLLGAIGATVVMISALLTALYLLPLSLKAFFPGRGRELKDATRKDPPASMGVPVMVLTILILLFGIMPSLIVNYVSTIVTLV